jgi:2'-5' RNA ligase
MTQKDEKRVYLVAHLDEATERRFFELYGLLQTAGMKGLQTPDFPHHITLGDYNLSQKCNVLARAQEVCRNTRAFTVRYYGLGLFGLRVLFAAPGVNRELLNLREALVPDNPAPDLYEWVAHTTLLMDEPETVLKAIPIVANAFEPFSATVESVGVYEFSPIGALSRFPMVK